MGLRINPITMKLDWYDPGVSVLGDPVTPAHGGTGTSTAFTAGSVVFAGAGGVYEQDNANFNYSSGNLVAVTSLTSLLLRGGVASGGNLTLSSTSHATKGIIIFGTSLYDEVNNRLGVRTSLPLTALHIKGDFRVEGSSSTTLHFKVDNSISTTFPRTFFQGGNSVLDSNWFMRFADAYSSSSFNIPAGFQVSTNNDPSFTNADVGYFYVDSTALWLLTSTGAAGNGKPIRLTTDANIATTGLFIDTVTNGQRIGIGNITAPTARLHLAAGTTAASTAPLKFTSGALNTTAEAGAMEFLTDDYSLVITTGTARKGIVLDDGTRLTSGRIPFATTNGRLTNDADLTFVTDTLTATKVVGTTSVKVGTAAGFISSDGSAGATGSFTTADLKTVTVKDGIIVSII